MAIITRTVASAQAPDGQTVTFQYDYDDATLLIRTIRCINPSSSAAYSRATLLSANRTYEKTWQPGQPGNTEEISIPTGQASNLQLFVNANGKLDGVDWETRVPA
jgi:hypothetical protein